MSKAYDAMIGIVKKFGFEILSHYPKDLDLDASKLEELSINGSQFFWCIGDHHSHLYQLGISKEWNEMPSCLTNLSSKDRFFHIRCNAGELKFDEVNRETCHQMANWPLDYKYDFKEWFSVTDRLGNVIASIDAKPEGTYDERYISVKINAKSDLNKRDVLALESIAYQAASHVAGSHFTRRTIEFQ